MSPVLLGADDALKATNSKHGKIKAVWCVPAETLEWAASHVCTQPRHQRGIIDNGSNLYVYTFLPGTPQHALFWRYPILPKQKLYCSLRFDDRLGAEYVGADVPLTMGSSIVGVTKICVRARMEVLFPPPPPPPATTPT